MQHAGPVTAKRIRVSTQPSTTSADRHPEPLAPLPYPGIRRPTKSAELIPVPQTVETESQEQQEPQDPVLSIAQRRALLALLTHPNIRQAAKSVGIHERTLRRWLANPTFRDALDGFLDASEDELLADLEQGAFVAVAALRSIAADRRARDAGRIEASKHLLEYCERRTLRYDLASLLRRP